MLFNSFTFLYFLIISFGIYWFILGKSHRLQNAFLLAGSYVFYGWWDWRFLWLILLSSLIDFFVAIQIGRASSSAGRKGWLAVTIVSNLSLLFFFKYYNFFVDNFAALLRDIGLQPNMYSLNIILPVGISFYTFQTMSYSIDVYRKDITPSRDAISFLAYVSFFPQLVAGPIERAKNLLPQFQRPRLLQYEEGLNGLVCIFWGLFKKVVIADNCAVVVNAVFEDYTNMPGVYLVLGTILFAFQIYCDFSGYSDIAIGAAKLFGFSLMINFRVPYFSRSIAEFWRRWHISLTTWFRDYVYFPMGGSRGPVAMVVVNTFVIFLLSGVWHGANWTFVAWGVLNAIYFIPLLLTNRNRRHLDTIATSGRISTAWELLQVLVTFSLTCFAWIFFRSASVGDALDYIASIFGHGFLRPADVYVPEGVLMIFLLLLVEWIFRVSDFPFQYASVRSRWVFVFCTIGVTTAFRYFGAGVEFIYFQF